MRSFAFGALTFLACVFCARCSWGADPQYVDIVGTVTDAAGAPIASGEVHVTFAGGGIGDFKKSFKDGQYAVHVRLPHTKPLPLMIRLTLYADDNKLPPRWVEHLSPRIPAGTKQEIHVVLYTDDQLKKANLGTLYAEGQQLEKSLVLWMDADHEFKTAYRRFFLLSIFERRRNLIYTLWEEAKRGDDFPKGYNEYLRDRFSEKSALSTEMKKVLPPSG